MLFFTLFSFRLVVVAFLFVTTLHFIYQLFRFHRKEAPWIRTQILIEASVRGQAGIHLVEILRQVIPYQVPWWMIHRQPLQWLNVWLIRTSWIWLIKNLYLEKLDENGSRYRITPQGEYRIDESTPDSNFVPVIHPTGIITRSIERSRRAMSHAS